MNSKVLASMMTIWLAVAIISGGTYAKLTTTAQPMVTNLDLKVNQSDDPNVPVLVTIEDLKPSYVKYSDIDVNSNATGKMWVHLILVGCSDGIETEPELLEDPNNNLFPVTDFDLSVESGSGTNIIIPIEDHITLEDAESCWIPLGQYKDAKLHESFHLQDQVTNWAQGDKCYITEEFGVTELVSPFPPSGRARVWDPTLKMCKDIIPPKVKKWWSDTEFVPMSDLRYGDTFYIVTKTKTNAITSTNPGGFYININVTNIPATDSFVVKDEVLNSILTTGDFMPFPKIENSVHVYLNGSVYTGIDVTKKFDVSFSNKVLTVSLKSGEWLAEGSNISVTFHVKYAMTSMQDPNQFPRDYINSVQTIVNGVENEYETGAITGKIKWTG
jgi:hypothetical protein